MADIIELLGGDERAVRIARKILLVEMWCNEMERRWLVAHIAAIADRVEQLLRRAA